MLRKIVGQQNIRILHLLSKSNFSTEGSSDKNKSSSRALEVMHMTEQFVESEEFKQRFPTAKVYTKKYSWFCLHSWIILFSLNKSILSQTSNMSLFGRLKAIFFKRRIERYIEEYTRDQVYQYQEYFDRSVYEELTRSKNAMFWSLDEYFLYRKEKCQKSIEQIILEDLNIIHSANLTLNPNQIKNSALQSQDQETMTKVEEQKIEYAEKVWNYLRQQISTFENISLTSKDFSLEKNALWKIEQIKNS